MISLSLPILPSTDGEQALPVQPALLTPHPVRQQVWSLLSGMYPRGQLSERRFEPRFPYPHLLYLTSLAKNGVDTQGDSIVVVGKDLSESGMSFFHPRPLADRHMIVSLEAAGSNWLSFLIDISWCRFTRQGWYFSGGRFLETRTSPLVGR